jgi:hypothetical protein
MVEVINADFSIDGDLHISGQGRFTMENGTFKVEQEYIYENEIVVTEKGILRFANTLRLADPRGLYQSGDF